MKNLNKIYIGYFLLFFIFCVFGFTNIGFFLNIPINICWPILSMIFSTIIIYYLNHKNKNTIIYLIISLGIISLLCLFTSLFIDVTWDSNNYHKLAIGLLKNGWIPNNESSQTFLYKLFPIESMDYPLTYKIWVDSYGKMAWIFSANIYNITNNIESTKIVTYLFAIIVYIFVSDEIYKKIKDKVLSNIASIIIFTCPVFFTQMNLFYVDGLLYLSLILVLLFFIQIFEDCSILNLSLLGISLILCINIKYTGLLYSGIFCLSYFIFYLIKNKSGLKLFLTLVISTILAIVIFGYNTYITNYLNYKNPVYPLFSKDIDIIYDNEPIGFENLNDFEKVFISIFSVTENNDKYIEHPYQLKIPFTTSKQEFKNIIFNNSFDIRLGGFGPFFSGMFLISIGFIIYEIIFNFRKDKNRSYFLLMNLGIILFLCFLPNGWWARFSFYLYFPIIYIWIRCIELGKNKFTYILLIFVILNITMFIGRLSFIAYPNIIMKENLELLKEKQNEYNISVYHKRNDNSICTFYGILFNLNDNEIYSEIIPYNENNKSILMQNLSVQKKENTKD